MRVKDGGRFHLEGNGKEASQVTEPSLKPSYVEGLEARAKAAEQKLFEVQTRFDQLRQQLQRETDETRQRLNRAADERAVAKVATFIQSLLPVLDDLHRAIDAAGEHAPREAVVAGLRGIATSFANALTSAGVEPIQSVGEVFNPELHEAVDTAEAPSDMDGKVMAEYSRGFKIGERLLRPARVKVARSSDHARRATE